MLLLRIWSAHILLAKASLNLASSQEHSGLDVVLAFRSIHWSVQEYIALIRVRLSQTLRVRRNTAELRILHDVHSVALFDIFGSLGANDLCVICGD